MQGIAKKLELVAVKAIAAVSEQVKQCDCGGHSKQYCGGCLGTDAIPLTAMLAIHACASHSNLHPVCLSTVSSTTEVLNGGSALPVVSLGSMLACHYRVLIDQG